MLAVSCENRFARLRLEIDNTHIHPRVTISRPTMILLNETSVYAEIISSWGELVLALTTNPKINFSSKPKPFPNLL